MRKDDNIELSTSQHPLILVCIAMPLLAVVLFILTLLIG